MLIEGGKISKKQIMEEEDHKEPERLHEILKKKK